MKQRATTPAFKGLVTKSTLVAAAVVMAFSAPMAIVPTAFARDYNAEKAAVQRQIDQYQAEASRLSNEAKTLENELAKLASEKAGIQALVDLSQTRFNQLTADIAANEKKIAENKDALGVTLADMYVDTSISPLEMLASSNNVGDYVDKQSYRSSVNDQLKATIAMIDKLKKELESQKKDVERVLADQTAQREALVMKEAERQKLMDDTKGQENAYQKLSADSQAKMNRIQSDQQDEINRRYASGGGGGTAVAGDPNKGGYPAKYANSDYYALVADEWGMYTRQCVSYTAWKVYQKNGYMPFWGAIPAHAKFWPQNARAYGYATGNTPRVGSAGVVTSGQYGHIVWVDSINSDGTLNISQYNELNRGGVGWGHYSERKNVSPSAYDEYIYF